jgi:hypothetical protein
MQQIRIDIVPARALATVASGHALHAVPESPAQLWKRGSRVISAMSYYPIRNLSPRPITARDDADTRKGMGIENGKVTYGGELASSGIPELQAGPPRLPWIPNFVSDIVRFRGEADERSFSTSSGRRPSAFGVELTAPKSRADAVVRLKIVRRLWSRMPRKVIRRGNDDERCRPRKRNPA